MPKSKSHMPVLLDIIDASCTSRWIFVLARRTPQAPTQGLCVGMYSTCEVHAKYAHTRTRHTATHFQRSQGSKWPKFNDIFEQKKVQRLSIDRALTCWTRNKGRRKCDAVSEELIQCFKDFWLFWKSHPCHTCLSYTPQYSTKYPFLAALNSCSKSDDFRPQPVLQGGEAKQWTWNISITFYGAADDLFFCWTMQ